MIFANVSEFDDIKITLKLTFTEATLVMKFLLEILPFYVM